MTGQPFDHRASLDPLCIAVPGFEEPNLNPASNWGTKRKVPHPLATCNSRNGHHDGSRLGRKLCSSRRHGPLLRLQDGFSLSFSFSSFSAVEP